MAMDYLWYYSTTSSTLACFAFMGVFYYAAETDFASKLGVRPVCATLGMYAIYFFTGALIPTLDILFPHVTHTYDGQVIRDSNGAIFTIHISSLRASAFLWFKKEAAWYMNSLAILVACGMGYAAVMWFEENTLAGLFLHLCLLFLIFFIQRMLLAAYDLGLFDGMVACLFGKIVAIREKEPKWAKIVMCILAAMVLLRDFLLKVLEPKLRQQVWRRQQAWRRRNAGTGGGDDQA